MAEAFRLGVAVDLAHSSEALTLEAAKLARGKGRPVMLSHTGAAALCPPSMQISSPPLPSPG